MASIAKRYRSRRRLAALAFLSNISLDGSYTDTKLGFGTRAASGETAAKKLESRDTDSLLDEGSKSVSGPSLTVSDRRRSCSEVAHTDGKILIENELADRVSKDRNDDRNASFSGAGAKGKRPIKGVCPPGYYCSSLENIGSRARKYSGSEVISIREKEVRFHPSGREVERGDSSRGESSGRRRHTSSGTRPLSTMSDGVDLLDLVGADQPGREGQEISYSQYLVPSKWILNLQAPLHTETELGVMRCLSYEGPTQRPVYRFVPLTPQPGGYMERGEGIHDEIADPQAGDVMSPLYPYSANLLDNPSDLASNIHTATLTFSSYRTSVINFIRPGDVKKELNDKFKERFPAIQLTLSKLRSIKREMKKVAQQECGIDLLTVAQSYVFFEKLILKNWIVKQNRKLCAGACLLISAKMNDVKRPQLKELLDKIESVFRVNRKDLLTCEFAVLVALDFSAHIPTWEVLPHFQRLLYDS